MNPAEHRLRVVRDLEDESPEVQGAGKQLAERKPIRISLWRRLVEWVRSFRRRDYVDTVGMGTIPWAVYVDMMKFARQSGDRKLLDRLKLV